MKERLHLQWINFRLYRPKVLLRSQKREKKIDEEIEVIAGGNILNREKKGNSFSSINNISNLLK
jgi:hypothetical protein